MIDAKEDKELAPSNMSARLSLHSPHAGSGLLSFLCPIVSLRGLRTFCGVPLILSMWHNLVLLLFCLHAASLLLVGSHVQRTFLRPIVTYRNTQTYQQSQ